MSTTRTQRIGIWVIAVVLTIGTIGSFFVIILANNNSTIDQQAMQKKQDEYTKLMAAYQAKVDAQNGELTTQYFSTFSGFASEVAPFDAGSVTALTTRDLKVGDGAEIKSDTAYSAYYIGWNPEGKIFDQSIDGQKLKSPIAGGNLIAGWNEGVIGMKVGGVRELTIPADKAYGDKGSGDLIPPHTPIKFIVMIIPTPAVIPQPDLSSLGL